MTYVFPKWASSWKWLFLTAQCRKFKISKNTQEWYTLTFLYYIFVNLSGYLLAVTLNVNNLLPLVFWCFQEDQKGTLGRKGLRSELFSTLQAPRFPRIFYLIFQKFSKKNLDVALQIPNVADSSQLHQITLICIIIKIMYFQKQSSPSYIRNKNKNCAMDVSAETDSLSVIPRIDYGGKTCKIYVKNYVHAY